MAGFNPRTWVPLNLGAGVTAAALSAGGDTTCVLTSAGSQPCVGNNAFGQMGLGPSSGTAYATSSPRQAVAATGAHTAHPTPRGPKTAAGPLARLPSAPNLQGPKGFVIRVFNIGAPLLSAGGAPLRRARPQGLHLRLPARLRRRSNAAPSGRKLPGGFFWGGGNRSCIYPIDCGTWPLLENGGREEAVAVSYEPLLRVTRSHKSRCTLRVTRPRHLLTRANLRKRLQGRPGRARPPPGAGPGPYLFPPKTPRRAPLQQSAPSAIARPLQPLSLPKKPPCAVATICRICHLLPSPGAPF